MACKFTCDECGKESEGVFAWDLVWRVTPMWHTRILVSMGNSETQIHACSFACMQKLDQKGKLKHGNVPDQNRDGGS